MESATCLSSCSVVLRYLVSGAGVIHGEFPLRQNISYASDAGKNYDFNTADTLNTLLLNCMFASGQLKEGEMYYVDFDHQFIETEMYDAKPTYKKFLGYRPGVAVIGDLIVGIENSDGNTNVPFHGTFSRHGRA